MKTWLWGMVMGVLGVGCQSSSSPESTFYEGADTDTISVLPTADASPCEAIWKSLPALTLPYAAKPATESPESREPFPPYLQSWLAEKLGTDEPSPLYTPIGQIRYPSCTLWLIEGIDAGGTYAYALLVSPDCQIHDKIQIAGFKGSIRYLLFQSTIFHPDGTLTLTEENHTVDLSIEPPRSDKSIQQLRYRVDPERRKFVAL